MESADLVDYEKFAKANNIPIIRQFEHEMLSHIRSLREIEGKGLTDIEKVYEDAVVFITGGTGFLGRQLIEKLLRSCPRIRKIYILARQKKGRDSSARMETMIADPVFDELRSRCPDFRTRLLPIEGDIASPRLGIRDADWELLREDVNFIFHVAATVRFDEPLKRAVHTNVRGTREVVLLAQQSKGLRCLVHVSTAFSHCNRHDIKERFYKSPMPPDTLIDLVDSLSDEKLDAITHELIKDWPNTYTYTKAVAEEVINTMCHGMPACVVRPASVVAAYQEPTPGWLDINNGPSGILLSAHMGLTRVYHAKPDEQVAYVPVDFVNNLTIAASWETIQRHADGDRDIKIYTVSRIRNPETNYEFLRKNLQLQQYTTPTAYFYTMARQVSNIHLYRVAFFFLHWIPSLIADPLLALAGSKIRLSAIYKKVQKGNLIMTFFAFNSWNQYDDNTLQLYETLPDIDRKIFEFNITNMDKVALAKAWCLGLRKFVLKDGLTFTAQEKRKMYWFSWLHKLDRILMILYAFGIFKVMYFVLIFFKYCCRMTLGDF